MTQETKILKLSNGDEIITVISHADKSRPYIEVKNPLQVNLYPKATNCLLYTSPSPRDH